MRKSARTQIPPFFDNDPYIHVYNTLQTASPLKPIVKIENHAAYFVSR